MSKEKISRITSDIQKTALWVNFIPFLLLTYILSEFFNEGFFLTLIFVIGIYFVYIIFKTIVTSITFSLFLKQKFINYYLALFRELKFPNPVDYYIDDSLNYLAEVSADEKNGHQITIISAGLFSEISTIKSQGHLVGFYRINRVVRRALEEYMKDFPENSEILKELSDNSDKN